MSRYLLAFLASVFVLSNGAFAQVECPELNTLQVMAGYLSWLGFFKVLGAVIFAAGILFFFGGFIVNLLFHARVLVEILAYAASAALIAGGYWVSSEYLTWTVFIGCILFMGSIYMTIFIHRLEGDDPKPIAALLMCVWGAVAIYYNMPEVGTLAVLALMTLLGFTVIVGNLSYGFGWEEEGRVSTGTTAALLILAAFVVQKALFPNAPTLVQVFSPGAFWAGSIVAFTGLLIMSNNWYDSRRSSAEYFSMQVITIAAYLLSVAAGMILGIDPLAGAAGVFLVLYLAAKPLEVPRSSAMGFGVALMCSGGIMFGAWYLAMQNLSVVERYLTTTIG